MAESIQFSRQDVERLKGKLNRIRSEPELDDREKRFLLAILESAEENTPQPVSTPADMEGQELRTQIVRSFVRDDDDEDDIHVTADIKIGVKPKRPPGK
jgi:hypothetical protein